jgi:hypothetical protein
MKSIVELFKKVLELEKETPFGKVNTGTLVVLAVIAILYFSSDLWKQLIFGTVCVIKTVVLEKDIAYYYHETDFIKLILPTVLVGILCLGYMAWYQWNKNKLNQKSSH